MSTTSNAVETRQEKLIPVVSMPDPALPYGISLNRYDGPVSWAISALVAFFGAVLWLRRRTSRDNTEIAKDRAETNLVSVLREERDRAMNEAREAWARRTGDAEKIAHLEAENGFLKRDVQALSNQVNELKQQLGLVFNAIRTIKPDFALQLPPPSQSS
jgi:hypothetical protein